MPTPNPNGQPDSYFISWVRRKLRDQAAFFAQTIPTTGTDGVIVAGAKPYRTQRAPIWTGGILPKLTAPFPTNSALTAWNPVYDLAGAPPTAALVISDGGAGAMAAGTYQVFYTFVYGTAGESGPSPLSNAVTIAINHLLSVPSISGIPAAVTLVNFYFLRTSAAGNVDGFYGSFAPVGGVTPLTNINGNGNGVAPVLIVTDTGEILFPAPPIAGNLNISYPAQRFSDLQILNALTDGMKAMYPTIWQLAQDTSLIPSPVFFEYTLPAVFADMRVTLIEVELRIPNITVVPYQRYKRWSRPGPLTLAFKDRFSPAGSIRLNYNAPYNTLSDLETIAMHLPCYYAMHLLLKEQDAMRSRATEMVPQTGEGGSKSGDAMALSRDWKDTFDTELDRLGRPAPNRPDAPQVYEIVG